MWLLLASLALGTLLGVRRLRSTRAHQPSAAWTDATTVACAIFEVEGVPAPASWLGAAASQLACDRVARLRGLQPDRTISPPELLDMPRGPTDDFPRDAYDATDVRERSLRAARARGTILLDGAVARVVDGFRVRLVLRAQGGAEIGRAAATATRIWISVRDAVTQLVRSGALVRMRRLRADAADWYGTDDPLAATALDDLAHAVTDSFGSRGAACAAIAPYRSVLHAHEAWIAQTCEPLAPRSPPPPLDRGSPSRFARSAIMRHAAGAGDDLAVVAAELDRTVATIRDPQERARVAFAAATLQLARGDHDRGPALAMTAARSDPRNARIWYLLAVSGEGTSATSATAVAWSAWAPGSPQAWRWSGLRWSSSSPTMERLLVHLRRAVTLDPDDASLGHQLGTELLVMQRREEARGIADELVAGEGDRRLAGELLRAQIEATEARFRAALERGQRVLAQTRVLGEHGIDWALIWHIQEVGEVLGSLESASDAMITQFVDPEPPLLAAAYADMPLFVMSLCLTATRTRGVACVERLRGLIDRHYFTTVPPEFARWLRGADRYVHEDWDAAAETWRPLVRSMGFFVTRLRPTLIDAFERAGENELVDRLATPLVSRAGSFNGADMRHAWAAEREHAAGHVARARELAQQVIQAWSVADEVPPVVATMRRIAGAR